MFDKIVFISDHAATIKLKDSENITMNLMNLHIVFEDATKKVLGQVDDVEDLPSPDLVTPRNGGYLVGTEAPYDLYIVICHFFFIGRQRYESCQFIGRSIVCFASAGMAALQ